MAKTIRASVGSSVISVGTTGYNTLAGSLSNSATESQTQIACRPGGTFTNLYARLITNTLNVTLTVRLRKNTANANANLSITAGSTGEFEDTTSSDTFADGDLVSLQYSSPAGTGSFTPTLFSILFDASTNTRTQFSNNNTQSLATASTTRYMCLSGSRDAATMAQNVETNIAQSSFLTSCTLKNLGCNVTANARTTTTTVRTRKNAANGAQSLSIGNTATGRFEDTTNSDSIAANDEANYSVTTGTGTQTITWFYFSCTVESTTNTTYFCGGFITGSNSVNFGQTRYAGVSLVSLFATVQDEYALKTRIAGTSKNLTLILSANTINGSSTLRVWKNGGTTSLVCSIGASTTGIFTDPTNTVSFVATDNLVYQMVGGGSSGGMSVRTAVSEYVASAGAQNFQRNITNEPSVSVSEALARILNAVRTPSEGSVSVSEALARAQTLIKAISEATISVSEELTKTVGRVKTINEPAVTVGSESLARILAATRSISESSLSVNDTIARLIAVSYTLVEPSISVSETLAGVLTFLRSINESAISVDETLARILAATRTISDPSISTNDTIARIVAYLRLISDPSISISEALVRFPTFAKPISETAITTNDSIARVLAVTRSISESSITVNDTIARIQTILRQISESSITVDDSLTASLLFVISMVESRIKWYYSLLTRKIPV